MSPNHPRGQRSHGEIINRNAKGMGNGKTDFEKTSLLFTDEMKDNQSEPRWTFNKVAIWSRLQSPSHPTINAVIKKLMVKKDHFIYKSIKIIFSRQKYTWDSLKRMEGFYGGIWESRCRNALSSQGGDTSFYHSYGTGEHTSLHT